MNACLYQLKMRCKNERLTIADTKNAESDDGENPKGRQRRCPICHYESVPPSSLFLTVDGVARHLIDLFKNACSVEAGPGSP